MPDDRFRDLGPASGRGRDQPPAKGSDGEAPPAERLAELDSEPAPHHDRPPPPASPRPRSPYAWVVGVVFILAVVVAGVNSVPNAGRGLRGPAPGRQLPEFSALEARGRLDGDANIRQRSGGSDSEGERPACDVRQPGVINICDLSRRAVALTFIGPGGGECNAHLDRVERVRRAFREVNFVGVVSSKERDEVAELVRRRRWGFPVTVDRDNAVFNLYRVGLCGTTVFAYPGGEVRGTKIKVESDSELRGALERLLRAAGDRAS